MDDSFLHKTAVACFGCGNSLYEQHFNAVATQVSSSASPFITFRFSASLLSLIRPMMHSSCMCVSAELCVSVAGRRPSVRGWCGRWFRVSHDCRHRL